MDKDNDQSFAFELLKDCKAKDKRNFIIIIVLIACLLFSNMAWLYVFQSYDYESTITVEGKDSPAIYQNNNGEVHLDGKDSSKNNP